MKILRSLTRGADGRVCGAVGGSVPLGSLEQTVSRMVMRLKPAAWEDFSWGRTVVVAGIVVVVRKRKN